MIMWVYLHLNSRVGSEKHFETVRNGRSRSSEVVDFGSSRKRMRLPISDQ